MAKAITWCPKQIPNNGLLLAIISFAVFCAWCNGSGSPGPFDKKYPSGLKLFKSS